MKTIAGLALGATLLAGVGTAQAQATPTKAELLRCNAVFAFLGVARTRRATLPAGAPAEIGGDNPTVWRAISQADPQLAAMPARQRREHTLAQVSTANADYFDANIASLDNPSASIGRDWQRCATLGIRPDIRANGPAVNRADWDW